jgi:outer membrane lipase/esterase
MGKKLKTLAISCAGVAASCGAITVHAQALPPPITTWVDQTPGVSENQRQAGYAVQRTCTQLSTPAEGGFQNTNLVKRDLFARCNEMANTAAQLLGRTGGTIVRSLGLNTEQMMAGLQQVSGEELAAQGSLSTQVSAGQFANISGRLNALRLGTTAGRGRVARLDDDPNDDSPLLAMDRRRALGGGAAAESQGADRPVGWFVESSYGFGDHDQTRSEDAFDFDSISVTTGTDYNFGSGVVGISFGFDRYQADFDNATLVSGGELEVEGMSGSVFGAWYSGGWNLNGIATYGSLESDVSRRALYSATAVAQATCVANTVNNLGCGANRTLSGNPDGSYIALGVTFGYELSAGGWDISPSLSANYRDVDIDGYAERDSFANGGLALAYDDQTIKSKRAIAAVAFSRPISRTFGVLVPSFRAEWHHEFEDDARAFNVKYANDDTASARNFACTVSCFTILTDEVDSDFAVASVGLSAVFAQRLQAYVFYEALLGSANLSGNSIALGLRGQF